MQQHSKMMNRKKGYGLGALALVLGLTWWFFQTPSQPKLPKLNPDSTILAFGDSLTFGQGVTLPESYPSQLATITKLKVINAGQNGRTSAEGLALLPDLLEETQPDLVLLCLGGNDFLQQVPVGQTTANLRKMLIILQEKRIPVVLIAVPEFNLFSQPSPIYSQLAQEYKIPLELETLSDLEHQPSKKSDPIHFNAAGYRDLAESVAKLLKETGALPK